MSADPFTKPAHVATPVPRTKDGRPRVYDLDDFAARHRGPSRFDHDHDCYESWMLLHDEVRTLLGDDDE